MIASKYMICILISCVFYSFVNSADVKCQNCINKIKKSTLILLHVIFRHGDRTPDVATFGTYPKDIFRTFKYFPFGPGALTRTGQRHALQLGHELKRLYRDFIGDEYNSEVLDAMASSFKRTQTTLQTVLAGMYPISKFEALESGMTWQPIPYKVESDDQRKILAVDKECKDVWSLIEGFYKNDTEAVKKYEPTLKILTQNTGIPMKKHDIVRGLAVSDTLETQYEFGLKLEDWTKQVFPEKTRALSDEVFKILANKLGRSYGGGLLEKIMHDTEKKLSGDKSLHNLKLFLYSGHDANLATILGILDAFKNRPPYRSYIAFEIHVIYGEYFVKVFYQDHKRRNPLAIKIPTCGYVCPWKEFQTFVKKKLNEPNLCQKETENKKAVL